MICLLTLDGKMTQKAEMEMHSISSDPSLLHCSVAIFVPEIRGDRKSIRMKHCN